MKRTQTIVLLSMAVLFAGATTRAFAGFADAPATGKVLWTFTGAKAATGVSTAVHCSNLDRVKTVALRVEFYSENNVLLGSNIDTLAPGASRDFSTGAGTFYSENLVTTGDFEGSVRVISDSTKKVLCSAQVMSSASPPTFAYSLPSFDKSGKH
jgi:hypothetical protein